jgi:hypothetical protein
MGIEDWSTTPASNNAAVPNGWPEGMAPSGVNDSARQMMADLRTWYEDAQWIDYGHVPTRTGNTTFTIPTDVTATYTVGRRIKATDSSTIYGTITASSYGAPNTTVTISSDSGNLSASLTAVAIGDLTPTSNAIPYIYRSSADVASAGTINLNAIRGDLVDVTGTTTITAVTLAEGQERTVRFTGILTLTNGASLVLPGNANITTAAGDIVKFRGYASSVVRAVSYSKLGGGSLGAFLNMQTITATGAGTYTPTAGMRFCIIDMQGGGGGSGGTTGAGGQSCVGGAGGSGARMQLLATAANIGASAAVSIGIAGTAGTSGNNAGGTGGDTTITINASTWTSAGGVGGGGNTSSASAKASGTAGAGGANTTGSNATLIRARAGQTGSYGFSNGATAAIIMPAMGGISEFGSPGALSTGGTGTAATGYGAGGSGAYNGTGGNLAGGAGTQGIITIWEFA